MAPDLKATLIASLSPELAAADARTFPLVAIEVAASVVVMHIVAPNAKAPPVFQLTSIPTAMESRATGPRIARYCCAKKEFDPFLTTVAIAAIFGLPTVLRNRKIANMDDSNRPKIPAVRLSHNKADGVRNWKFRKRHSLLGFELWSYVSQRFETRHFPTRTFQTKMAMKVAQNTTESTTSDLDGPALCDRRFPFTKLTLFSALIRLFPVFGKAK